MTTEQEMLRDLSRLAVYERVGSTYDWIEFHEAWTLRITITAATLKRLHGANFPRRDNNWVTNADKKRQDELKAKAEADIVVAAINRPGKTYHGWIIVEKTEGMRDEFFIEYATEGGRVRRKLSSAAECVEFFDTKLGRQVTLEPYPIGYRVYTVDCPLPTVSD